MGGRLWATPAASPAAEGSSGQCGSGGVGLAGITCALDAGVSLHPGIRSSQISSMALDFTKVGGVYTAAMESTDQQQAPAKCRYSTLAINGRFPHWHFCDLPADHEQDQHHCMGCGEVFGPPPFG